jgi:hypothetical protein
MDPNVAKAPTAGSAIVTQIDNQSMRIESKFHFSKEKRSHHAREREK